MKEGLHKNSRGEQKAAKRPASQQPRGGANSLISPLFFKRNIASYDMAASSVEQHMRKQLRLSVSSHRKRQCKASPAGVAYRGVALSEETLAAKR